MADTALSNGDRAAHAKTLTAATAETVTFGTDYVTQIEVTSHDGASAIYFTVDGSTPTVGGAATYFLPASISTRTVPVPPARRKSTTVKLISAATPIYSVTRLP